MQSSTSIWGQKSNCSFWLIFLTSWSCRKYTTYISTSWNIWPTSGISGRIPLKAQIMAWFWRKLFVKRDTDFAVIYLIFLGQYLLSQLWVVILWCLFCAEDSVLVMRWGYFLLICLQIRRKSKYYMKMILLTY